MHIRENKNSLDFEPEIDEFLEKIFIMLQQTINIFKNFKRLPYIMLENR